MKLSGLVSLVLVGGVAVAQGWVDRSVANGPASRRDHAMCYDPVRNYVLMAGGKLANNQPAGDTWSWDGTTWTAKGPAPVDLSAMAFHPGASKLFGFEAPSNAGIGTPVRCYEWDGSNWINQVSIPMVGTNGFPAGMSLASAFDPTRNELLVIGTDSNDSGYWQFFSGHAVYDGTTWRGVTPLSGLYPARGLGWDPSAGKLVISYNDIDLVPFGGSWITHDVARYAEWSGLMWAPRFAQTFPSRSGPMSTDTTRGVLLQFDGTFPANQIPGTAIQYHTWRITQANCEQLITLRFPTTRVRQAMTYDPVRNVTVLFGGQNQFGSPMGDTCELTLGAPASFTGYGNGCPGSRGVPQLFAINNDIPRTGSLFETQVNNLPWNAPTFLLFGLSNTNSAGLPLPFDLSVAGAPGCTLLTSIDNIIPLTNVLGSAVWSLQMPHLPGASFYLQAVPFEASANSLGVALSNGGHGLLGL